MFAIFPYLGALEKEQQNGKPLAEDVVMRLTKSFHRKRYHITTDDFFTTVKVAQLLQNRALHLYELSVLMSEEYQKNN